MPKLRFGLTSLFYAIALLASALAVFGSVGIILSAAIIVAWIVIFLSANPRKMARRIVVALVVVFFLIAILLPAVASARSDNRTICKNNLRKIALALLNYESEHGTFPPAYIVNENGQPMHSWRVLILPYVDEPDLYDQYNFDEPWDGPNNSKLLKHVPYVYRCPSHRGRNSSSCSYVAVTGPRTMWRGGKPFAIDEITDGAGDTIMLTETPNPVPWTKPQDISADEFLELFADEGRRPPLPHRIETYFVDYGSFLNLTTVNSRQFEISKRVSTQTVESMLTIAGGEEVDWTPLAREATARLKLGNIISLTLFLLLAVLPAVRLFSQAQKHQDMPVDQV